MMVKIVGTTGKGRSWCGHIIRKAEPYFIISENGNFIATCQNCIRQRFGRIPGVREIKAAEVIRLS